MDVILYMSEIRELLQQNRLPYEDLGMSKITFHTHKENGVLVGCIGLEAYGEDGLLRSLAVADACKGKGLGRKLVSQLSEIAKGQGILRLHLLTTTAHAYFKRLDFEIADRSEAPPAIAKTKEFSEICPASSV